MKDMVLMTKEEYGELDNLIKDLRNQLEHARWDFNALQLLCSIQEDRANNLWDVLNRPAVEAAAEKHENEFLDWCADKAAEYEEKDFDDWCLQKAKFYNNNQRVWCKVHHIPEEDYEKYVKYDSLLCQAGGYTENTEKTEGWTELYKGWYSESRGYYPYWMIYDYQSELYDRWDKSNSGYEKKKIWRLRESLEDLFWDQDSWKDK